MPQKLLGLKQNVTKAHSGQDQYKTDTLLCYGLRTLNIMASSQAGRMWNPMLKVSADVNGDFSSLLPYQKRQALEAVAGARKSAEKLEAANAPQPLASSPTDNADNGQSLTPNPGRTTTTTS